MDGILCINKPTDYTSFDVIAKIRGMSKTKRVGHSGTLDPLATGVLPVFIGIATKACDLLPEDNKSYIADFKLGITTDTLDVSGEILTECETNVTKENVVSILDCFRGEISQLPPMYSAVKINGQRLYDIARQGKDVERPKKNVTIFKLELINYDDFSQSGTFEIVCSKGTYIRTIIADIGDKLGCGAMMTSLCRTKACGFSIEKSITLEQAQELTAKNELQTALLSVDEFFGFLPKIQLDEIQSDKFVHGVQLDLARIKYDDNFSSLHRVYSFEDKFLALAELRKSDMALVVKKMFAKRDF